MSMETHGNGNITPNSSEKLVYNMCEETQTVQDNHTMCHYDAARHMAVRVASGDVLGQQTCVVCDEWFGCFTLVAYAVCHLSAPGITCLIAPELQLH